MRKSGWMIAAVLLCMLPATAFANSSWRWLSETRPFDVLPVVAAITVALETLAVRWLIGKGHTVKIVLIVLIANLASFAAPYLLLLDEITRMPLYPFWQTLERMPFYTVGTVYLLMTLAIEVPIVSLLLRRYAKKKWLLWLTVIGANILTTGITAAVERLLCYGQW